MSTSAPSAPTPLTPLASEETFRSLFDGMAEMAVIHEVVYDEAGMPVDYRILDCNAVFSKLTGIRREQAVGALASRLYGTGKPPYFDVYVRVATTGVPEEFDSFFPPLDKHFSIRVTSPGPGRFATLTIDVTPLKQLAKALDLDERRLDALSALSQRTFGTEKALIDFALGEAVRLTGSEIGYFHFVHAEASAIELHTWPAAAPAPAGSGNRRAYPLAPTGVWADLLREKRALIHNDFAAASPHPLPAGHVEVRRHLGCPVVYHGQVVALTGVGNKQEPYDEKDARQLHLFFDAVYRRVLVLRAESERRRLEQQVQRAQKMESLGRFAAGVAHDFNNLLATIQGNLELALQDLPPASPAHESLADARESSVRAAELVQRMLGYAGMSRLDAEPIDLSALLAEFEPGLRASISRQAELRLELRPGAAAGHRRRGPAAPDRAEPGRQRVGGPGRRAGRHHGERRAARVRPRLPARGLGRRPPAGGDLPLPAGRRHGVRNGRRDPRPHLRPLLLHQAARPRAGARADAGHRAQPPRRHPRPQRAGQGRDLQGAAAHGLAADADRAASPRLSLKPGAGGPPSPWAPTSRGLRSGGRAW
ncbi:MAG: GAF domain-containing protein [Myxococcales bacterium]